MYNSEKYIRNCLDSLLNQGLAIKDYEIIVVNDGSTDGSEQIVRQYNDKYENIKIITVKNGGQSYARNIGIDNANGDYLFFVDSDDLSEGFDDDAKYKLLSNKKFNGKKCAVIRITQDGETLDFYFNLANYELIGASQGSGEEKVIITIDTKTVVKIPNKAKNSATYKELSFEE